MSKREEKTNKWASLLNGRIKDVLLMGILAVLLFSAAWAVFSKDNENKSVAAVHMSETEEKLMRILQEIDGVGEASVVVCEDENEVQGVVVVCEGANDLRVVMSVREAVSAALNTEQKSVKIYLKKGKRR